MNGLILRKKKRQNRKIKNNQKIKHNRNIEKRHKP